jgi:hypothetical protein
MRFPDLVNLIPRYRFFGTMEFFTDSLDRPSMYPAPVIVCYHLFFLFGRHSVAAFLIFAMASILTASSVTMRALMLRGLSWARAALVIVIALVTSWAFFFEIHQANMEICVWTISVLGIWCFFRGRSYTAAACFGIAGSMKIFPFILLALFLQRRQFKQIAASFGVAALVSVATLWWVYPNVLVSWQLTATSVTKFRSMIMLKAMNHISYDHSIWAFIKTQIHPLPSPEVLSPYLTAYLCCATCFVAIIYIARLRKLPIMNQVLCLIILSILLPPTSFAYTLMHLYIPLTMLALYSVQNPKAGTSKVISWMMALMALALAPTTEMIWNGYAFSGQIECLALSALLILGLRYPLPSMMDSKAPSGSMVDFSIPHSR